MSFERWFMSFKFQSLKIFIFGQNFQFQKSEQIQNLNKSEIEPNLNNFRNLKKFEI
jgi:hypothetical protein